MKAAIDIFNGYLHEQGIRHSRQRECILETFLASGKHPTVIELYNLVRKNHPRVGYATVYRTMKLICGAGLAEGVDFGEGAKRFELKYGHKHHDHLICSHCGRYVELVDPQIEKLQDKAAEKHGFELKEHKMYLFGICKDCRVKEKRKKEGQ